MTEAEFDQPFDRLRGVTYIPLAFRLWIIVMRRDFPITISIIAVAAGIEIPASGRCQQL